MTKRMRERKRGKWAGALLRPSLVIVIAVVSLVATASAAEPPPSGATAQLAQDPGWAISGPGVQGGCINTLCGHNVCNAGESPLAGLYAWEAITPCTPGGTGTYYFMAEYYPNADRYMPGVWIATDGGDALAGQNCYRDDLEPVAGVGETPNPVFGPYRALDADTCGDIQNREYTYQLIGPVTISCVDVLPLDNLVDDISTCGAWDQNAGTCTQDLPCPGSPAKCKCELFSSGITTYSVDLSTEKIPPTTPVNPGDLFYYTIRVTNNSTTDTATALLLKDDLDFWLHYDHIEVVGTDAVTCRIVEEADVGETPIPGWGEEVSCRVTTSLAPLATYEVKLYVQLHSLGDPPYDYRPAILKNTACVTSPNQGDANLDNNCDEADVVTTPVTLAQFQARRGRDGMRFVWSTATETGNVGFNLYVQGADGLERINAELIPSQVVTSIEPQQYGYTAVGVAGNVFYLEEVSVRGETLRHGPFTLGRPYGARPEVERIDWAAIQAEHQVKAAERAAADAGRIAGAIAGRRSGAATEASAARAPNARKPKPTPTPLPPPSSQAPVRIANLEVDRSGIYRLTHEVLLGAGFDLSGVPAAELALTNRGVAVPIRVVSGDLWGGESYLEFVGEGLDTLYTDTNVYTLWLDAASAWRIAEDPTPPNPGAQPPLYYMETATFERRRAYDSMALDGNPWYDTQMLAYTATKSWSFDLTADNYVAGDATTLLVDATGSTSWTEVDPDHHLVVALNGTTVADERFDGRVHHPLSIGLPAGMLVDGANSLVLTLPGDTGANWDIIRLNHYGVVYPRAFQARGGVLAFTATDNLFAAQGLPIDAVVVYRVDGKVTRLAEVAISGSPGAYTAMFAGSGAQARYLVYSADALLVPGVRAAREAADITGGTAGYLVISHPDFLEGLAPLVAARQGLDPRVVNVEDVYEQFGYGIFDPQAIRDYIAYAIDNMGTKYVLLVGGDTYDYRNYKGLGSISFVPSLYAPTDSYVTFAPVDPLYTDVNADRVPDRAIGRLPVRTLAELEMIVGKKTLDYASKDYGRTAVYSADDGFATDSDSFVARVPADWTVQRAYLDVLELAGARSALLEALNQGVAFASYIGHSGPTVWTFDGLFNAGDAAALTNYGRPTVVSQWGCWNSYYVTPAYNTLAHKFLLSGDQGAAATLGSVALSYDTSERWLGELLTPRLLEPGKTIGAALQEAKAELAASQPDLADVLLGWTILGDPALVIQP